MPIEQTSSPSWIDSACLYARECGWRLVPFHELDARGRCTCGDASCERAGAHPRFDDWWDETANDERTIESWEPLFPSSHLGVVCGSLSDLVILECNELHGRGQTSASLIAEGHVIPQGTPHATDRGERSLYFFRHPGARVASRVELGPGLTLYGDGATVRVPHDHLSRTRSSLRWRTTPLLDPIPHLPEWISDAAGFKHGPAPVLPEHGDDSLPFVTASEIMREDRVVRSEWLLRPWLWRGGLTLVTGSPLLAGKTTWCLHMARTLISGGTFLGYPATPGPVVYLSEDDPGWFRQMLTDLDVDSTYLSHLSILHASAGSRGVAWEELMRGAVERCHRRGARVLFIDSLPTFADTDDLTADAGTELRHAIKMATEAGITVVATVPTLDEPVQSIVPHLGGLAGSAQVVLNLRASKEHRRRTRMVEVASRLEAPTHVLVELRAEGLRALGWPTAPLFDAEPTMGLFVDNSAAA